MEGLKVLVSSNEVQELPYKVILTQFPQQPS